MVASRVYDSCFSIFGKTTSNKQKSGTKKATWFTAECKRAKKQFYTSKQLFKECPNIENKSRFFADKKSFRNIKRRAERSYLNQTKGNMSNLS